MARAHGYSRRVEWREPRISVRLALPAPPGHVPEPLPGQAGGIRRERRLLPRLWALLGAGAVGFLGATALIDLATPTAGVSFVHPIPLGAPTPEAAPSSAPALLRQGLARLIVPAPAPPPPRAFLPPDVREAGAARPAAPDDAAMSMAGLLAALYAPVVGVGPFGEPLPPPVAAAPAPPPQALPGATWAGAIGLEPTLAARPPGTVGPLPAADDDAAADEPDPTSLLPPGAAPLPPPAAPRLRNTQPAPRPATPRIVARQDVPPANGGPRIVTPPPAPRTASAGATLALPPLPEARNVAVARPIPPPDGFAPQAAATMPAAGATGAAAAWQRFARPFDHHDIRPRIAIVVVDLGLAPGPTDQAIHYLPGAITLAFSPFADSLPRWIEQARRAGHETLLHLPLEASADAAVVAGAPPPGAENLGRIDWALARATGYVGVANLMNSVAGEAALRPILASLRDRGVLLVDRQAGPRATSARLAGELGLPRAAADREIDADPSREAIDQRLAELERIARETGVAVATIRPHAVSFERLSIWSTTLETKGIALAPITAVLNRQRNR